jgi:L-rhamnose-H+ transport protein
VSALVGFLITLVAGTGVGVSMWPLKWARTWKWENFWFAYAIFSLIIVPFVLAFSVLPHLGHVYSSLGTRDLLIPFLLGLLWGFAQLGAGICVSHLGLAIGSSVLNGIGAAVGTIIPLVSLHSEQAFQTGGILILAGIAMMLCGVYCCGWSGYLRENEARDRGAGAGFAKKEVAMRQSSYSGSAYLVVIGIAVASGILASLTNIALAYSGTITRAVQLEGGRSYWAPFAVWPIVFLGGSIANVGYAMYLMTKNGTWSRLTSGLNEPLYPLMAACLWMGGIALYSSGTTFLGSLGVSVGFAVFMISMILSGQFAAILTGEWKLISPRTYTVSIAGVALLVVAVVVIGLSHYVGG